jgi:uncharacterized protein YbjT (DUF2867 family)
VLGEASDGSSIEEKQGKSLIDAAVKHSVKHFVYSSADRHGDKSINNPTDVPHFISKYHIEHHLIKEGEKATDAGFKWTILRPVAFMDNFQFGFIGKMFPTAWRLAVRSRPLQLVAVDDIGVFAAKAFLDPEKYAGKSISLAGDELTFEQMNAIFKAETGADVPTTWGFVARLILWLSKEMGTMFRFFEREGFGANIKELKKSHPELKALSTWLHESWSTK